MPFLIENNRNGILVEPNSEVEFTDAIKHIIAKPEKANQVAINARKTVELFDWDIVKQQWLALLQ